jgi:uncharacterized membrane protein YcaP (DUF421 family)
MMFHMDVPWWELAIRSTVVYAFLILILRISGKRQIGQMAPFDLVLLLILPNAVQNSMSGGDNSLVGGLIIASVLVSINFIVGYATYKSKKLEALVEGRPQIIIHNGVLYQDILDKCQLTQHELKAAMRESGCDNIKNVRSAILENNGVISVIPKAS